MLILLSPAKSLDFNCKIPDKITSSKPSFQKEAWLLSQLLKAYSTDQLAKLMKLSPNFSKLNHQRFQEFSQEHNNSNSKPAIYAYNGDVYEGINLDSYNDSQLNFANQSIRIISGLYGVLKAFDLIQAYRLEMSIALANPDGKNLYDFWKNKVTEMLNAEKDNCIINLASKEYSSAIDLKKLSKPLINIHFKENLEGSYKVIGIYAKKARGLMADFIISNLIKDPENLKNFCSNGYKYIPELSSQSDYIFARHQ